MIIQIIHIIFSFRYQSIYIELQQIETAMISKLEKYAKFINMPLKDRIAFINEVKPEEMYRGPIPGANESFEEDNFVSHTVFDTKKPEEIYKIATYRENSSVGEPKAIVALFHGLMSHTNRGVNLAKYFAKRGITTIGMDYRGFGKSQGIRGYIQSEKTHLSDCEKFINLSKQVYPKTPFYSVGLSLGGATAYHLSLRHKSMFKGNVLMAPALMPSADKSSKAGQFSFLISLAEFLLPRTLKALPVDVLGNCRNPNYDQYCKNDELFIKDKVRVGTIASIKQMLCYSKQTFADYDQPFLIVQGGADKLIDPQVAFDLYSKSKTSQQDKEIIFYEDMFHDIWHQPQIESIQEQVANWILERASKQK